MALAATTGVNLLCLQEARLTAEGVHAMRQGFRAKGWKLLHGPLTMDGRGGVAVVTDWPVELLAIPLEPTTAARFMGVKVHRPQQRPLLVINGYLPANDDFLNQHLTQRLLTWAANTGEDFIFLADWNREARQQPLSQFLSSGLVYAMDNDALFARQGTHRRADGGYSGRVLDYGVASPGLAVANRQQVLGPADHDLVHYDVSLNSGRRGWRWQPQRRLATHPVSDWTDHWPPTVNAQFERDLAQGDTEAAWRALSAAAEDMLAVPGPRAPPRGVPGTPVKAEAHTGNTPALQTLRERKLRRAARRLREVLYGTSSPTACDKLQRYLQHLLGAYPDLHHLTALRGAALLEALQQAAAAEEARANAARLQKWKADVKTDLPRLARWIKASTAEAPSDMTHFAEDPAPQAKIQRAAQEWTRLWCSPRPDGTLLRSLLRESPLTRVQAAPLWLTGAELLRRAGAAARKAAGCDGWAGRHWKALPPPFFELLADVWNAVLRGAPLPGTWSQVRVCLIPKPDGGERPLAIAALAWRLGASALVQKLAPWIGQTLPHEIYGGMPGRGIDDVHALLTHEMYGPGSGALAGCKADVRKCYDSADPRLAIECLRHMGAPTNILDVLGRFYMSHERWLQIDGHCARSGIGGAKALLQGCPFSPLCLGAMMAFWVKQVQKANTGCTLAIYLDDRSLWTRRRRGAADAVVAAMKAGAAADVALGFQLHPAKLESFGTSQAVRERLLEHADTVGTPQTTFILLGIPYCTTKATPVATEAITASILARCRRIQICGQGRGLRRALLRRLVIPLFRWCSPWLRTAKTQLTQWAGAIERAVWGGGIPRGRSPALAWSVIAGLELHPRFVAVETTVLREHRRLQLGRHATAAPGTAAAMADLGWTCAEDRWITRHGTFQTGTLSASELRRWMHLDWTRKLFQQDPKSKQEGGFQGDFDLTHHLTTAHHAEGYLARVLVGAATDARHLCPKNQVSNKFCPCGMRGPTRTHLTFDCSASTWNPPRRTALECRLLLPLRPSPTTWPQPDYADTVTEVAAHLAALDDTQVHYVATDGGCLLVPGAPDTQRASWAVAFPDAVFSGLVSGPIQTPAQGERIAVFILGSALLQHGRKLRLLVDNQTVACRLAGGVAACARGDPWRLWQHLALAVPWLETLWIPAHGRVPSWTPPSSWISSAACRQLNQKADSAASAALLSWIPSVSQEVRAAVLRRKWAEVVVSQQFHRTRGFHDDFVALVRRSFRPPPVV